MATTYTPINAKLNKLMGTNARVDDILFNASSKTDNWAWFGADQCLDASASTVATIARNAQGDYSLNRTAGGAETHTFFCAINERTRLASGRSLKITDVVAVYQVGVVDATSVDVLVDQTVFANAVAPAQSAHGGTIVDASYDAAHNTAALRKSSTGGVNPHLAIVTLPTPVFINSDLTAIYPSLVAVLANTGTFRFYGFGIHYTTNYL